MKKKFLSEVISRGFFNQCTDHDQLERLLNNGPIKAYIGFDCTAESIHVGSLLQIMVLRLLQKYGHQPIVLLGGGTTLIGDPSGKDSTRKILDNKTIQKNIEKIKKTFAKLLDTKKKETQPIFVNNYDWLSKLKYIDFLRNIGKHFTINKMLSFDSVKLRLDREQSLSYTEFNYMILQAYDFYQLNKQFDCILQIGGSDQWGNIINGVELIRKIDQKNSYGLTTPLITLSSGAKMGKTEKGAIWLNESLLSPYDYWQFWRNTEDVDVERFLKYFTDISVLDIEKLIKDEKNINNLKIILANEATKILHGDKASIDAAKTAEDTFKKRGIGKNLPEININKKNLDNGISILDLISSNNIMSSKSEVRRSIKNNAIKINDELIKNEEKKITFDDFKKNNLVKISCGKKKHYIIKII